MNKRTAVNNRKDSIKPKDIRSFLPFFGYRDDEMTVYLCEDRNDGEDKA